ncbi:bifunctional diguanylate cyclase/phosphodiesterase [Parachitinimonas caeni]|uniref:PAS domain S-box protein n=1 Tax=Parachitinimonas caeni TaxID=3031301 RepID=A0ABT7DW63_9NEIS|nr:PAS domain S-box protein [Parachitinimonas caeni]MDK2124306.1 PAS domain S-box protein [Parachitinimonas caeni]
MTVRNSPMLAPTLLFQLGVLALYLSSGLLSRQLALSHQLEPLVWLPAGVGVAMLHLGGLRRWPLLAAAATGLALLRGEGFQPGLLAVIGAVAEAMMVAALLRRYCFSSSFSTINDGARLATFAAAGAMLGASIDMLAGHQGGFGPHAMLAHWLGHWLADTTAIMVVTPLVVAMAQCKGAYRPWRYLELLICTVWAAVLAFAAFGPGGAYPSLQFVLFPVAIVAGLRLSHLGASMTTLSVMGTAVGAMRYVGNVGPDEALSTSVVFGALALTGLVLAASRAERTTAYHAIEEQRAYLRKILDALPTYMYLKDLDGRYIFVNRAFAELFGLEPEAMIGKTVFDLLAYDDATRFRGNDLNVATSRISRQFEESFVLQGRQMTLLSQKFPIIDENGRLTGTGCNATDITQRKHDEQALREAEERFRALVEQSLIGIYFIKDDHIIYASPQMATAFGYPREQITGMPLDVLIHPDDLALVRRNIARRINREVDSMRYGIRFLRADGEVRYAEVHSRLASQEGEPVIIGALLDVTDRLQAQKEATLAAAVFDNANEGFVVMDRQGIVLTTNHAALHMLDVSKVEIVGAPGQALKASTGETRCEDMMIEAARTGRWHGECQLQRRDGGLLPVDVSLSSIRDEAGDVSHFVAMLTDISGRRETEHQLEATESKFKAFVELSLAGIYVVQDGILVYGNPRLAEILGYTQEQLIGTPVRDVTSPEDLPKLTENHRRRLAGEVESVRYVYRAQRRDGSLVDVEAHGRVFQYNDRPAVIGILIDVSDQLAAERQLRLSAKVFENASEGILITDADTRIIAVNAAFTRITGYSEQETLGTVSRMFNPKGDRREINRIMFEELNESSHWQGEMVDRRKSGELYPVWLSISAVRDASGRITNFVGVFTDYTSRKEAEERLYYLANHDPLTSLPNRTALNESLIHSVNQARKLGEKLAVLFIDLDRFKAINDTLGHAAGDHLLQTAASRLRACLSDEDTVGRLGGDEFTVVLETIGDPNAAAFVAQRILDQMGKPFTIDGHEMFVTCSIGISLYPNDGQEAQTLLKNADIAMYRAKECGKNNYQFFAQDMNAKAFEHLLMENSLRYALERREFVLHYQPQVATADGRVEGLEALIRWRHPDFGLVPPTRFVPLAEETGLIVSIGEWAIREVCLQTKAWLDEGLEIDHVAVNLSARQFASDNLLPAVHAALVESGLPPALLELELTESLIMKNPAEAVELLKRLQAMGVQLSIDDFGTGYSSLSNLKHFPLHNLKIDRSFIESVPYDDDSVAITEAIIAIARKMKLRVIAEGVENVQQFDYLRSVGCDLVQGYLFSPAVKAEDVPRLLKAGPCPVTPEARETVRLLVEAR